MISKNLRTLDLSDLFVFILFFSQFCPMFLTEFLRFSHWVFDLKSHIRQSVIVQKYFLLIFSFHLLVMFLYLPFCSPDHYQLLFFVCLLDASVPQVNVSHCCSKAQATIFTLSKYILFNMIAWTVPVYHYLALYRGLCVPGGLCKIWTRHWTDRVRLLNDFTCVIDMHVH